MKNNMMDMWKIVHIPDKPPIPPNQQPTGELSKPNTHSYMITLLFSIFNKYIYLGLLRSECVGISYWSKAC